MAVSALLCGTNTKRKPALRTGEVMAMGGIASTPTLSFRGQGDRSLPLRAGEMPRVRVPAGEGTTRAKARLIGSVGILTMVVAFVAASTAAAQEPAADASAPVPESPSAQPVQPAPQSKDAANVIIEKHACGNTFCLALCELNKAFFALGGPTQYIPPPSGWSVVVPPIPPPPAPTAPGETPKQTPPRPFKTLFYENDFRYLDNPDNIYTDPFDVLKRIRISPDIPLVTDLGGEFRWQGKREDNRRLDGKENNYNLFRERLYFDTWYDDLFRVYVEGIWADSSRQTQVPLVTDINHGDLLNAFGELRLFNEDDRTLSARYGRQELLFGNQRLVSPLDWVNTRRTFDDVARVVYRSPNWDLDAFWGRPIIPRPRIFDYGTHKRYFYGTYAVYKGIANQTFDFYFLGLSDGNRIVKGNNGVLGVQDIYTFGTRWQGSYHDWLWESEGAYQFGDQANLSRSAGMATGGVGRRFADLWAKPELWFYYDYASGD